MHKVGLLPNINRDRGLEFTDKVARWLCERGCDVYASYGVAGELGLQPLDADALYASVDFIVCLGGDGTMLRASHNSRHNTPILGINLGRLGYLTDAKPEDAFVALERTLNGEYVIERRMMLEANSGGIRRALNDVCVTHGMVSKLLEIELQINEEYIDTYRADGMIVCTPTGSTAYNLSAGGPILKPDIEMITITPICAHMIYSRSIVVSSSDVVKLKIISQNSVSSLSLDGCHQRNLSAGDEVSIKRSEHYTHIIKTNKLSFFDILRSKMVGCERG